MPVRLHVFAGAARHAVTSSVLACRLVCRLAAVHLTPLLLHLSYFLAVDLLGFLALLLLRPSASSLRYVDVLFMSTSAVTVTGLATVEMEDLSGAQLAVLTLLMLLGSEMFVSLLGLVLDSSSASRKRRHQQQQQRDRGHRHDHDSSSRVMAAAAVCDETDPDLEEAANHTPAAPPSSADSSAGDGGGGDDRKERESRRVVVRSLALVLSAYMAAILVAGSLLVLAYVAAVPTARDVLARKGISGALFAVSNTVSSFTNGGLLPTNESMAVFTTNRGLLLLLAGQILAGGTLLPVFLRLAVSATRAVFLLFAGRGGPDEELHLPMEDMEKSAAAAGFGHLLPSGPRAASLAATVVAVAAAAAALLCCMNWNSAVFAGLTAGEKLANAVFMAVNVRQAGENSVDCSLVAPAVLVLFLAMMCIPASATLLSMHDGDGGEKKRSGAAGDPERIKDGAEKKKRRVSLNSMLLSPLACNAAAVMLACITERRSIAGDPLNFSTFNVIFEVISAYGNVGLSTGYSCSRLPAAAAAGCHDKPYSFSGWWSDQGKLLLVLLMLYGRLKGFHGQRRRRWTLFGDV